jgi:hypothetical protein
MKRSLMATGHEVLYRQHQGGRLMGAMPMAVMPTERPELHLYVGPGVTFWSGRGENGAKARNLSDWSLQEVTWTGGRAIKILSREHWFAVDVEFDAAGTFMGWYINIQTPADFSDGDVLTQDLVLDVLADPDGSVRLKDVEDFIAATRAGLLPAEEAAEAVNAIPQALAAVSNHDYPFWPGYWDRAGVVPPAATPTLPQNWASRPVPGG